MVTIYDLAKYCGVSSSTVSKVINNYDSIPLKTQKKVKKAMEELGYIPSARARSLSKGISNTVGILAYYDKNISPFVHQLFTQILDSFQKVMNENLYELVFVSNIVGNKNDSFLKNCISRNMDGILLFGNMYSKEMTDLLNSNFPIVAFDYLDLLKTGVTSENYILSKRLTDLVISYGHKKIVYVIADNQNKVVKERLNAFKDSLKENNVDEANVLYVHGKFMDQTIAKKITHEVLDSGFNPSCILYPDDYTAIASLRAFKKRGVRIPEDISITGFDGLEVFDELSPRLTTVKQDTEAIGRSLALELISQIKDKDYKPRLVEVPGQIIVGETLKNLYE